MRTSVKKRICVLSVLIEIIPTPLLCQMQASPPGVEFLRTISKCRKRNKISSLLVYVLHKTRNQACSRRSRAKTGREMYKKAWCTCKVVVLLIKPIVFLTFSLPSASLDLKVPSVFDEGERNPLSAFPQLFYRQERTGICYISLSFSRFFLWGFFGLGGS